MKTLILMILFSISLFAQTRIIPFSTNPTPGVSIPDSLETALTVLWCEDDVANVTKDANNKVTVWNDLSDANNDLAQSDTSKSPTWSSSGLTFDGADDFMEKEFTLTTATIYAVLVPVSWGSADRIWTSAGAGTSFCIRQFPTPSPNVQLLWSTNFFDTTTAITVGDVHVAIIMNNGASSLFSVDNVTQWSGDIGSPPALGGIVLSSNNDGSANWGNIRFRAVIVRKYADDATTITNIYNYLNSKY